jgi:hypothetical protein
MQTMEHIDLIKFDKSFHGSGWYDPEHYSSEHGDVFYRWMASGEACSISLLSNNESCCIVYCDVMSMVSSEVLEYLEIDVDGQPAIWSASSQDGNGVRLQFLLPVKTDLEACEVTFKVTKSFKVGVQDVRNLSFAFREITVTKVCFETLMELLEVRC